MPPSNIAERPIPSAGISTMGESQKHVTSEHSLETVSTTSSSSGSGDDRKLMFLRRFRHRNHSDRPSKGSKASLTAKEDQSISSEHVAATTLNEKETPMPKQMSCVFSNLPKIERTPSEALSVSVVSRISKPNNVRNQEQRDFWKSTVMKASVLHGQKHLKTAEALMNLGHAHFSCEQYADAGKSYLSALKIYYSIYGGYHLCVARALDKLGLSACKTNKNLDLALQALEDSLQIRCEFLGMDHVDSIDTLNNIAGVRLNKKQFKLAAKNYYAVLEHRQNIFGRNHASVAVTAFTLGYILDRYLKQTEEANEFYVLSLQIYRALGMGESPQVLEILKQMERLPGPGSPSPEVHLRLDLLSVAPKSQELTPVLPPPYTLVCEAIQRGEF